MRTSSVKKAIAASLALAAASPSIAAENEFGVLQEIVVTAQKREESVLEVPISMSVVRAETLQNLSIENFQEMQDYVPNFMVTPTPSNSYIFIRGIGTQGQTLSFESSVALFVDGVYGGRNRQFMDPFFDVDRIEVLRGPQGALFGRNTSAGAISVTSARPTDSFSGWTQGEYETEFGSWSAAGAVSGPLSDSFQMRFAGRYAESAGYIENRGLNRDDADREDRSARISATWQPSDSVDVFAKLEYAEGETTGIPFEFVPGGGDPQLIKVTDDRFDPEHDDAESLNATGQLDIELGAHTLTAIVGHSSFEYDAAVNIQAKAPTLLLVANSEDFDQQSIELRLLSSPEQTVSYVAGVYFDQSESTIDSDSTTDLPFPTPNPPGPPSLRSPDGVTLKSYLEETESIAAFAQATWNISDALRVTGGVRYTGITKDGSLTRSFTGFAPNARNTPLRMERDEDFVDPSFNVQWDFAENWMAYATYAQGSKSGGFDGPDSSATEADWEFQDESSESYEVGVKGGFDSGYISVALFDTTYEDLQKSVLRVIDATFQTGNAAEAQSRGVEVEALWRPLDALTFNASLAYLDSEYTDYPGAPCPSPAPSGCSTNLAGFPLTNAPEWSGAVSANIDAPITGGLRFIGGLTAAYRDDVFYQPSYNPLEMQEAYWKLDVRAGVASSNERWSATLLVRNATDEETSSIIFETFPFLINPALDRVHLPDRPRTYTIQLRYNFE